MLPSGNRNSGAINKKKKRSSQFPEGTSTDVKKKKKRSKKKKKKEALSTVGPQPPGINTLYLKKYREDLFMVY
jgi:hypothetical protein